MRNERVARREVLMKRDPVAFFSYSQTDDEHDNKRLTELREWSLSRAQLKVRERRWLTS
jgi:hypothetical protein